MYPVFDPFFTTRERGEGTGLGLSIIHGIVKNCDGMIAADSKIGKGTVFTVLLPVINQPHEEKSSESIAIPTGHERILLIDDEPFIVEIVSAMLQDIGYRVDGRNDAEEALHVFSSHPENYDLIIMDMTTPGMTGIRPSGEPVPGGSETILLVEDEPAILTMTRMMLERKGYTVLTACTPGDAMTVAKDHDGDIHLLMTDIIMPEMNGRDLATNLLGIYPKIKLLFMSGYAANIIADQGGAGRGCLRCRYSWLPKSLPLCTAHAIQALRKTAFALKIPRQSLDLPVEKGTGHRQ